MVSFSSNAQLEEQEDILFGEFEVAKQDYKVNFEKLRQMRSEIEHIQKLMDKSKKVLVKQFGEWYELMQRQSGPELTSAAVAKQTGGPKSLKRPTSSRSEPTLQTKAPAVGNGGGAPVDRDVQAFLEAKKQMLARLGK